MTDRYNVRITADSAPIRLSSSRSALPSLVNPEILKLLCLMQYLIPNLKGTTHLFPAENHSLRFGGVDLHPGRFTLNRPGALWRSLLDKLFLESTNLWGIHVRLGSKSEVENLKSVVLGFCPVSYNRVDILQSIKYLPSVSNPPDLILCTKSY